MNVGDMVLVVDAQGNDKLALVVSVGKDDVLDLFVPEATVRSAQKMPDNAKGLHPLVYWKAIGKVASIESVSPPRSATVAVSTESPFSFASRPNPAEPSG